MKARLAVLAALPIASIAALWPAPAAAQDAGSDAQLSIALDQFDPSPAGDAFFGLPSPFARGRLEPRGYVMIDYADQPLRLSGTTSSGDAVTSSVVSSQMFLHVGASLALLDRALISLSLPIAVSQSGEALTISGAKLAAPSSAALGDLRVGARVRVVGENDGPAQLGVGAYVYVPTGPSGSIDPDTSTPSPSYTGDGSARVAPHLTFGGRYKLTPAITLAYTSLVGFSVRSSKNPTTFTYGAGVAALLMQETLQIGPEFYAATPIQPGTFTLAPSENVALPSSTNAELLIGARWRFFKGLTVGAAGGPGLSQALGTPSFRITGMLGWTPAPAPGSSEERGDDADKDGIADASDTCPYAAGPATKDAKTNGCPVLDDDDDGVPNDQDACPNDYAKATDTAERKGCPPPPPPPDTDGDGIEDAKDACPKEAGPVSQDLAKNGCAPPPANPDSDGDGLLDADDACPQEKGVKSSDPKANGCKTLVRIVGKQIAISQPIELKKGKGDVQIVESASEAVLEQVAQTLAEHPEITKLEIGAYTDNDGKESFNVKLSQARAAAVLKWLVEHGVAEGRLVATGYGPKNPIASNKTKEGRAQNKRVELTIVEKK